MRIHPKPYAQAMLLRTEDGWKVVYTRKPAVTLKKKVS